MGSIDPPRAASGPPLRSRFETGPRPPIGLSGKSVLALLAAAAAGIYLWLLPPSRLYVQPLVSVSAAGVTTGERRSPSLCSGARGCLVIYVAPWCGPCRASLAGDRELADYLSGRGVETTFVVGMDTEPACFAMAREIGREVLVDPTGAWAKKMKVDGVPHFLVADRAGKVTKRQAGALLAPPDVVARALGL